ncbi:MAG: copper resistance protein B [Dokdonella sp.]
MGRQTVSQKSLNARVVAAQLLIAGSAFCVMPLLAQSSNVHDEHAMHAPVAQKSKARPVDAEVEGKADDHSDHAMGNEVGKKDDANRPAAQDEHAGMIHGEHQGMDHAAMADSDMATMNHSKHEGMDHAAMSDVDMATMDHSEHQGMDHSATADGDMAGMDHGSMDVQGGSAPADARDPDYSDGVEPAHMHGLHMHGATYLGSVVVDHLEAFSGNDSNGQAIDMQAWYGGDLDKLWFKAESERSDGRQGATRIEALWNHAYAPYWGAQLGLRHDLGEGPSRDWAAFGVQGLAPYWFEVEATAYVGESGRTALRLEAEYELLLTQRLILQPDVELNFYGKDDPARGIGSGLSDLDVGLRLRYEFTRKFAPYVGVVWSRKFGGTADFSRAEGAGADDTQLVAGVRLWF